MNKANLFLVGAAKAGTTSLYHYLVNHKDVYAKVKEPWYFTNKKNFTNGKGVDSLSEYQELFNTKNKFKYYLDASPGYLCFPEIAEDIYNYNKNSKIIIILRDPIKRVKSYYRMYTLLNNKNKFKGTLNEFLNYNGSFLPILEAGLYSDQIREYIEIFKDNVLVLVFEEMINEPKKVEKEISAFLGINNFLLNTKSKYNTTNEFKNNFYKYLFGSENIFKKIVRYILNNDKIKTNLKNKIYKIGLSKKRKKNSICKETELYLHEYYKRDVYEVKEILNKDLKYWDV